MSAWTLTFIFLCSFNGDCACGPADGSGPTIQQSLTGDSCADMSYDLIHAVHFAGKKFN